MPYIYSTLAADTGYATYSKGGADLPVMEHVIYVKGKAGVADHHFITPRGVVTSVTDEELAQLEQNPVFKLHKENGYITVESKQHDVEKVVADMKGRDVSAPLVPEDYDPEKAGAKPETGKRGRPARG